jgi:hypothetical protein
MQTLVRILAIISCLFGAVSSSMAAEAPGRGADTPIHAREPTGSSSRVPAPMPAAEAASYAAREEAAPELEDWKGGASLSITLGTTALVVLAVLVALIIIF